jgi:hypothetical protein
MMNVYVLHEDTQSRGLHHKNLTGLELFKNLELVNVQYITDLSSIKKSELSLNVLIIPDSLLEKSLGKTDLTENCDSLLDITIYGPQIGFESTSFNHGHNGKIINLLSPWLAKAAAEFNAPYYKDPRCDLIYYCNQPKSAAIIQSAAIGAIEPIKSTVSTETEVAQPTVSVIYVALPFPVDVDRFKPELPKQERNLFIIYYKHTSVSRVHKVINALETLQLPYQVYSYGSYSESDYLASLQRAKAAIWLGCHESQGFAFQECCAADVPILVFDIEVLGDEIVDGWQPWSATAFSTVKASAASYWNNNCGRLIKYQEDMNVQFEINEFLRNYDSYSPRDFILKTLSPQALAAKWTEIISYLKNPSPPSVAFL